MATIKGVVEGDVGLESYQDASGEIYLDKVGSLGAGVQIKNTTTGSYFTAQAFLDGTSFPSLAGGLKGTYTHKLGGGPFGVNVGALTGYRQNFGADSDWGHGFIGGEGGLVVGSSAFDVGANLRPTLGFDGSHSLGGQVMLRLFF
jgi:hypothetical protein